MDSEDRDEARDIETSELKELSPGDLPRHSTKTADVSLSLPTGSKTGSMAKASSPYGENSLNPQSQLSLYTGGYLAPQSAHAQVGSS